MLNLVALSAIVSSGASALTAEQAKADALRYVSSLPSLSSYAGTSRGHGVSSTTSSTSTNPLCDSGDVNCCYISDTSTGNSCDIATFPKDLTTLVHPGGSTRCMFSYSTPYSFQVIPGRTDKVMFYFQGGGACWNKEVRDGYRYCIE
jgi:hypothetical protein